jgi:hypothetical protein
VGGTRAPPSNAESAACSAGRRSASCRWRLRETDSYVGFQWAAGRYGWPDVASVEFSAAFSAGARALRQGHIGALGGAVRVKREAPVAQVIERPGGMWLVLTADPWAIADGVLDSFERYLAPIIPSLDALSLVDAPSAEQVRVQSDDTERDEPFVRAGPRPGSVRSGTRLSTGPIAHDALPIASSTALDLRAGAVGQSEQLASHIVWERLPASGDRLVINIHLAAPPSQEQLLSLTRVVQQWYEHGWRGGYPPGGFHDLAGPHSTDGCVTWSIDTGPADDDSALRDLLARLSTWSDTTGYGIAIVRIGAEDG